MSINLTSTSTTGTLKVNGQDVLTVDASGEVSLRSDGVLLPLEELKGLGVGQSWQDLTSSRVSGVTYTNTTGKTIFVQCNASGYGTGAGNGPEFFVNGVLVQRFKYFLGAGQYIQANVGGFVPPDGEYLINAAGMNTWMEWR